MFKGKGFSSLCSSICECKNEKGFNWSTRKGSNLYYIIPHCTAGVKTSKAISTAQYFRTLIKSTKEASANYIVAGDGICGCVREDYRAWCSGGDKQTWGSVVSNGSLADHYGINFEMSSDSNGDMLDETFENAIKLTIDICKRYNKDKVLFFEDSKQATSYKPNSNEVVILFHCFFANKSCPGDWFKSRINTFIERINNELKGCDEMGCPYWKNGVCIKDVQNVPEIKSETIFNVGDIVYTVAGGTYTNGKKWASWLNSRKSFICQLRNNNTEALITDEANYKKTSNRSYTGWVNVKYLKK